MNFSPEFGLKSTPQFPTDPSEDIPFRMLDYRLRVYRLYPHKRMYQVVIYLRKSNSSLVLQNTFEIPGTRHEYNIIRLWEMPTEPFLQTSGLLPFAVLTQTKKPADVLRNVATKINQITNPREQSNIAASTAIIAGLVLEQKIIKQLLKEDIMKESVIYQDIQATSEAKGKAEGIQEGEANLVIRQLNRRLGTISKSLEQQIRLLNVQQLEDLAIALLDFNSIADLENWLLN